MSDIMNSFSGQFYKSESEKEDAAKKIWPEILYLCPEHVDFWFNDIFEKYLSKNEFVSKQSVFETKDRIEIILQSKNLTEVGFTGNTLNRLTKKGVDLKDGVLKHRILSALMPGLSIFRISFSRLCNIEPNTLDYLTADMEENLSINKKSVMSKNGDDYFVNITDKGKGYFLKEFYLNESKPTYLINQTINHGNPVTFNGNSNTYAPDNSGEINTNSKKNPEDPEVSKEANKISKKTFTWTVILGILGLLLALYIAQRQGYIF